MNRITELSSGFRRFQKSSITGNRTKHVITFNPNKAKTGEDVYIELPKLNSDFVSFQTVFTSVLTSRTQTQNLGLKTILATLTESWLLKCLVK